MTEKKSIKHKIFRVIQIGYKEDIPSRAFDIFIAAVIIINIAVMTLETFSQLSPAMPIFRGIEIATVVIFCMEYILRIWTADCLYPEESKGKAIVKFLLSFDGIVDLLTILPFFFLSGFVVFRMLRVVRIFHLFRINAQYDSFNVIKTVLLDKKNQIMSSVFILMILMLASSIGIYSAEHEAQPEAFQNAFSGIWWSVSALLTVGYGDIYPITVMGKIMAILTAFMGVGVVAIPTGIISAGFVEQYTRLKNVTTVFDESDLRFVTVNITPDHNWNGITVKDASLPKGLAIALILRDEEVIIPKDDVLILEGDKAILVAENFGESVEHELKEVIIHSNHPFVGHAIKTLDISRLTTIITIKRGNEFILPSGKTTIEAEDCLVVYSKADDVNRWMAI